MYVFLGSQPETLESGRLMSFGDLTDEPDQRLIDSGLLAPSSEEKAPAAASTTVTSTEKEPSADAAGTESD